MKTKLFITSSLTLAILLISHKVNAQEWQRPPAVVEIAEVKNSDLALTTNIAGNIVSKNFAWFSAETTGKLRTIKTIGSKVDKGDIIATLETTSLRAQREEQKNAVEAAGARIDYLRNQVKRLKELSNQNIASVSQIEDTQSQLDLAISNQATAKARLSQVDIGIAASKIRAQFDGTITEQGIRIGEWASPGQRVVRVVNTEAVELVARAPLKSILYAKLGDTFTINDGNQQGSATINALVPYGEITDGVYEIRMQIKNGDWRAGQSVTLQVPQSATKSVLTVPRDAILLRSGGSSVIKVNQDLSIKRIAVTTGLGNTQNIEVKSIDGELNIGDKVIIRGGERLQDGQAIVIKE